MGAPCSGFLERCHHIANLEMNMIQSHGTSQNVEPRPSIPVRQYRCASLHHLADRGPAKDVPSGNAIYPVRLVPTLRRNLAFIESLENK
jgi:hypothetical protein